MNPIICLGQLSVRDALNSAMDEEMANDPSVFLIGAWSSFV